MAPGIVAFCFVVAFLSLEFGSGKQDCCHVYVCVCVYNFSDRLGKGAISKGVEGWVAVGKANNSSKKIEVHYKQENWHVKICLAFLLLFRSHLVTSGLVDFPCTTCCALFKIRKTGPKHQPLPPKGWQIPQNSTDLSQISTSESKLQIPTQKGFQILLHWLKRLCF